MHRRLDSLVMHHFHMSGADLTRGRELGSSNGRLGMNVIVEIFLLMTLPTLMDRMPSLAPGM